MSDVELKAFYREAALARGLPAAPMTMPEQTLERALERKETARAVRWFWLPRATSNP